MFIHKMFIREMYKQSICVVSGMIPTQKPRGILSIQICPVQTEHSPRDKYMTGVLYLFRNVDLKSGKIKPGDVE